MYSKSSKIKYWMACLRVLKQDNSSSYLFKRAKLSVFVDSSVLNVPYSKMLLC